MHLKLIQNVSLMTYLRYTTRDLICVHHDMVTEIKSLTVPLTVCVTPSILILGQSLNVDRLLSPLLLSLAAMVLLWASLTSTALNSRPKRGLTVLVQCLLKLPECNVFYELVLV